MQWFTAAALLPPALASVVGNGAAHHALLHRRHAAGMKRNAQDYSMPQQSSSNNAQWIQPPTTGDGSGSGYALPQQQQSYDDGASWVQVPKTGGGSDSGQFVPSSSPSYGSTPDSSSDSDISPGSQYSETCVSTHNALRACHNAPPLQWDDNLAQEAKTVAETCVFAHSTPSGCGQNIAAGISPDKVDYIISTLWYQNELPLFSSWGSNSISDEQGEQTDHMTQIIWKATTKVGCYTAACSGGVANTGSGEQSFTVCNYDPPGNVDTEYAQNVEPPSAIPGIGSIPGPVPNDGAQTLDYSSGEDSNPSGPNYGS